jgi:hypothetical protein
MARIEIQTLIKAPAEKVYQASQDYSVRYEWDPFPESISILYGASTIEKGVYVSVTAKNVLKMEVKFIQVAPPTTATIQMIDGPVFLKAFSGSWVFKPVAELETSAKFIYSIKTKWWTLPLLSETIASWYFSRVIKARLLGLKAYCEKNS